ncbi:cysteine-rich secretory protein 4 [Cricetulus griseus]
MVDFEDVLNIGENGHERNRVDEKGIRSLEGMAVKYFLLFAAAAAAAAVVFVPVLAIKRALYNNLVTEFQTKPQEEIVKAHNVLRRTVYPTARNMLKMSWNKAAATNARILARYCDMSDSDPLERRLNETFCGENRHLDHYPHSWTNIIEIWHNESKHFTYGEWPSSDDDFQTNHYTQGTLPKAGKSTVKIVNTFPEYRPPLSKGYILLFRQCRSPAKIDHSSFLPQAESKALDSRLLG